MTSNGSSSPSRYFFSKLKYSPHSGQRWSTLLGAAWATIHPGSYPGDDPHAFTWLLAGILLIVEGAVLLTGRYLRGHRRSDSAEQRKRPSGRYRRPLVIYLAASIGIALLGALLVITRFTGLGPLGLLVCQPWFLSSLLGVKIGTGVISYVFVIGSYLLYFLVLFYPLYRVVTIDRTVDASRYRYMRMILALFLGLHLLTALLLAVAMSA